MVKVENLVAFQKQVGEIKFLGSLIWYSVSDMRVNRERLEEAFAEAGIDPALLPKPICPRDAFRRACYAGEVKGIPLVDREGRINIMVREVRTDKEAIIRQVVREVVDSRNIRLEYVPLARVELRGDKIEDLPLVENPVLREAGAAAVKRIRDAFAVEAECYNGQAIRELIGRILYTCRPVSVRPSGGVYFVPAQYDDMLEKLKSLAKELSTAGGSVQMWTVPVVDAEEQRRMVKVSLEEQVKEEADRLLHEMDPYIRGEAKVTEKVARRYAERVRELRAMVKEYQEMLETQAVTASSNLELVQMQAMALLDKVEVA
ncbi:MAG: hypothetical protein H5U02_00505 [Clostridia bacterium]|nr:hypothetical protein [Clostridia bacterium]